MARDWEIMHKMSFKKSYSFLGNDFVKVIKISPSVLKPSSSSNTLRFVKTTLLREIKCSCKVPPRDFQAKGRKAALYAVA